MRQQRRWTVFNVFRHRRIFRQKIAICPQRRRNDFVKSYGIIRSMKEQKTETRTTETVTITRAEYEQLKS